MMFASSSSLPKNKFFDAEDNKLRNAVHQYGTGNWKLISKFMNGRNARQCKDRWEKYLSPNINWNPFSVEDDIEILRCYNLYGPKWMKISKHFKGRTDISIKSRYLLLQRHGTTIDQLQSSLSTPPEAVIVEQKKPEVFMEESDPDTIFSTFDDFGIDCDLDFAVY